MAELVEIVATADILHSKHGHAKTEDIVASVIANYLNIGPDRIRFAIKGNIYYITGYKIATFKDCDDTVVIQFSRKSYQPYHAHKSMYAAPHEVLTDFIQKENLVPIFYHAYNYYIHCIALNTGYTLAPPTRKTIIIRHKTSFDIKILEKLIEAVKFDTETAEKLIDRILTSTED